MGRVLFKTDAVFDVRLDAGVRHDNAVVQNDVLAAAGIRPDVTGLDVAFYLVVVFLEELETRRYFIHVHIAEFYIHIRFAGVIVRLDMGE